MRKFLESFSDLYDYLLALSATLKAKGASSLALDAERASRLASGLKIGLSTEFVGEAKIALRRILLEGDSLLDKQEKDDIQDVLRQLTSSLNRWPVKPPDPAKG